MCETTDIDTDLDSAIFGKFGKKWHKTINSLAELLDVPVAIIFKREANKIKVISTNEADNNPFNISDTIPIEGSFCNYVFKSDSKFKVPDYRDIDLDINNVATQADFISYLGFPLTWPNGENFGTICLLDDTRNYFSGATEEFLNHFKDMVNDSLQLIDISYTIQKEKEQLEQKLHAQAHLNGFLPTCPSCKTIFFEGEWIPLDEFLVMDIPAEISTTPDRPSLDHHCAI